MDKKKRIFLGTTEIAGYYRNLTKGLEELGIFCKYVQLSPNTSGFGSKSDLPFLIRLPYLLAKSRLKLSVEPGLYTVHKTKKGLLSLSRFLFYTLEVFLRIFIVLPWAIKNFNVFCFGVRSNIVGIKTGYWDIALLKFLGKRIIYVYHGSDSRPPYINGSILRNLMTHQPYWEDKLAKLTAKTKNGVCKIDHYADVIVNNPYSAHFNQKPVVNWFCIGIPYCDPGYPDHPESLYKTDRIRILHAPTHRISKGTPVIVDCISRLKAQGFNLELVLVHGMSHTTVIHEIKKCDFVIDELYSDMIMAGLATEASFYAKPVIACGYVENQRLKESIPIYYCKPEELEPAVLKFLEEPDFRIALGKRAQKFVREEWSYRNIAARFIKLFDDHTIPREWYFDPRKITYLHGFGMPAPLLKDALKQFLSKKGPNTLQLEDKPELRDLFLRFSELN